MPFYKWQGVDLQAAYCSGVLYANTIDELSTKLHGENIALIRCRIVKHYSLRGIKLQDKLLITYNMWSLLNAGIPIDRALELVAHSCKDYKRAGMLYEAARGVNQGLLLHEALKPYPVFDSLLIRLLKSSAGAGNFEQAFNHTVVHLTEREKLSKALWSASYMPLVTASMFCSISLFALIVVIPQFEQVYSSIDTQLPESTRAVLLLSQRVKDLDLVMVVASSATVIATFVIIFKKKFAYFISSLPWYLPVCSSVIESYHCWLFFNSLTYQLKAAIPLPQALGLSMELSPPLVHHKKLTLVQESVASGISLANALKEHAYWPHEVIAMIEIGYQAGSLAEMTHAISLFFQTACKKKLEKIIVCFQPILLLVLGLIIGCFVYIMYVPLFSVGKNL